MPDVPFHNPYNFIPAPDRGTGGARLPGGLRDAEPAGHHRWHDSLWSGDIAITIRTVTPLLITRDRPNPPRMDAEREHPDHRHLEIATVTGTDGVERVELAPTQLKGMLRSAYEAVTCSRFGVFEQPPRLGYRTSADDAVDLRPALLLVRGRQARVQVYDRRQDSTKDAPAEVAKVPAWLGTTTKQPGPLITTGLVKNGAVVVALVAKQNYIWTVRKVLPGDTIAKTVVIPPGQRLVLGRLHITGPNVEPKGAERLVILKWWDGAEWINTPYLVLPSDQAAQLAQQYRDLVTEQRALHRTADRDGIEDREGAPPWAYLGGEPGRTAWSRHLYDASTPRTCSSPQWIGEELALPDETSFAITGWAQVNDSQDPDNRWIKRPLKPQDIVMLRPVMISRLLHGMGPKDLIDDAVRPAERLADLSPADRIFGWVTQSSARRTEGAYRGQLRIVEVKTPAAKAAVQRLSPLTIEPLSSPKPSQGRFYLGERGSDGLPQPVGGGIRRDKFFQNGQMLRGRKVYPHQERMVGKNVDELRRMLTYQPPNERMMRDSQNATLHEWVKPGVEFRAVLRIDNLNDLELGALLWLLDPNRLGRPNQPGRLKLGSGKPLGFGSVDVAVDAARTRLSTGQQIAIRLRALASTVDTADWSALAERFEQAMTAGFSGVIDAVRLAAAGFAADYEVHYPRPYRRAPGYEWFVRNEEAARNGQAKSLPLLGGEPLPDWPDQP